MKKVETAEDIYVYGRHVVMEAVSHMPTVVREVFLAEGSKDVELQNVLSGAGIHQSFFNQKKAHSLPGGIPADAVHQGAIACISSDDLLVSYKDFISEHTMTSDTSFLVLSEVQDPHNVGAAIRSAAAFGIAGVLIPPHNQAPVTGSVIKVSAGMAFRIPLIAISNVNTVLRDLKKKGFWVYGLDGRGTTSVSEELFERPSVFVLGNEATGLRKITREVCDTLISVPISARCESLNASTATAVTLYAWSNRHSKTLDIDNKVYGFESA